MLRCKSFADVEGALNFIGYPQKPAGLGGVIPYERYHDVVTRNNVTWFIPISFV